MTLRAAPLLLLLLTLLAPSRALAQQPAPACARSMWSCLAGCISQECAKRCAEPCRAAIQTLRRCRRAACPPGDVACQHRACPQQCEGVFGALPTGEAPQVPEPCGPGGPTSPGVPQELVGVWELQSGSFVRPKDKGEDALIRSDYTMRVRIEPQGCFVVETRLGSTSLGAGNALALRVWGRLVMLGEREWQAVREGGTLAGEVCGQSRAVLFEEPGGRVTAHVTYALEGGELVLESRAPDSPITALSFERVEP